MKNKFKRLESGDLEISWLGNATDKTRNENLNQDINKRKLEEKENFSRCSSRELSEFSRWLDMGNRKENT